MNLLFLASVSKNPWTPYIHPCLLTLGKYIVWSSEVRVQGKAMLRGTWSDLGYNYLDMYSWHVQGTGSKVQAGKLPGETLSPSNTWPQALSRCALNKSLWGFCYCSADCLPIIKYSHSAHSHPSWPTRRLIAEVACWWSQSSMLSSGP